MLAEARDAGLVERELARRQEPHFLDRVQAALGVDVEGAQGLDVVVEEVDAVGQHAAHGEEVDQPAADGKFARRVDLVDVGVAALFHLLAEGGLVEAPALFEKEGVRQQEGGRGQAIERGRERRQHHLELSARQLVQRRKALRHEVRVGREGVVWQGLPVREQADIQLRREPADFLHEPLRIPGIGREHRQRLAVACGFGQKPGIAGAGKQGRVRPLAGLGIKGRETHGEPSNHEGGIIPAAARLAARLRAHIH